MDTVSSCITLPNFSVHPLRDSSDPLVNKQIAMKTSFSASVH